MTTSVGASDDLGTSATSGNTMGDVGADPSGTTAGESGESGADTSTGTDEGGVPGEPGDPCADDEDCVDYCLTEEGEPEGSCVEACPEALCPPDFICVTIDTDRGAEEACVPAPDTFCQTCSTSFECGDAFDICAPLAGGDFCVIDCSGDPDICPIGFTCGLIGSVDDTMIVQQCVPNNGVCCVDGDGDVYGEGGGCLGTDCDDSNPDVYGSAPELCDGIDNDCDEAIDNMVIDCGVASCELGSLGYYETGAELCTDGVCEGPGASLCGLYTCVDGGDQGDSCAAACEVEDDLKCIPEAHCDASVCLDDVADGQGCDEASDCSSSYCGNGFCCTSGDCCQQASDCPTFGTDAPICTSPATCQGTKGQAICGSNFVCSNTGTEEDDSACDATVLASDCGLYLPVFCTGDVDQSAPDCATSCTTDAECDTDAFCDTDNTCQADRADGDACAGASWCVGGYCGNGFCCSGGDCCQQASDCPGSYSAASTCGDPANCQGTREDASCVANVCGTVANVPDDAACDASVEADACGVYPSQFCNGSESQNSPNCAVSCGSDADCDLSAYCSAGNICIPDEPNGDPCGGANQCQSGYCNNGFCCDGGDCCAANSDCAGLAQPATCDDAPTCQGARVDGLCQASSQCTTSSVDDDSACAGLGTDDCGLYPSVSCTADADQSSPACATSCVTDSDCDLDAFCDAGICAPDGTAGDPCGASNECGAGFSCADGVCCDGACGGTCEACDLAGSQGTCTPIADGDDPANECGNVSCGGYYFGWVGDTCYERANVADASCDGGGSCQGSADVCPTQGQGPASATCDDVCQDPDLATCSGTTGATCDPVTPSPNIQTCGDGACEVTTEICNGGAPVTCTPNSGAASAEVCDGIDNDCDPATADGSDEMWVGVACDGLDADLCEEGTFQCSAGAQTCSDATGDALELCDGVNNDCDPTTPDGADEPTLNDACDGTDADLCSDGLVACVAGDLTCTDDATSNAEVCDGSDNDCNPATADGSDEPWAGAGCDGPDADLCEEGTFQCSGGAQTCGDATGDALELCDGVNNDCDPTTPDGADEPTLNDACDGSDSDQCAEGNLQCSAGSLACSDTSSNDIEICNGLDDDCNGFEDDGGVCPCTVVRDNGRIYQICDDTNATAKIWSEADAACASGSSGYRLVAISDQAENDFLFAQVDTYLALFNNLKPQPDQRYFWIGGTDFCPDPGMTCGGNCCEGTWSWTNATVFYDAGATVTYDNWYDNDGTNGDVAATEPNNAGGTEHVTEFGRFYSVTDTANRSNWNDADGGNVNFYICEYSP